MKESTIFVYQHPDDSIRYIRCVEDGTLLLESKGKVVYLIVGLGLPPRLVEQTRNAYIKLKCKRCNTFYNIMIQII
jgi:hypothetical protein